jgi:hypothetical protein
MLRIFAVSLSATALAAFHYTRLDIQSDDEEIVQPESMGSHSQQPLGHETGICCSGVELATVARSVGSPQDSAHGPALDSGNLTSAKGARSKRGRSTPDRRVLIIYEIGVIHENDFVGQSCLSTCRASQADCLQAQQQVTSIST